MVWHILWYGRTWSQPQTDQSALKTTDLRSHKLPGDGFICTPVDLSVSELVWIQGFVVGQGNGHSTRWAAVQRCLFLLPWTFLRHMQSAVFCQHFVMDVCRVRKKCRLCCFWWNVDFQYSVSLMDFWWSSLAKWGFLTILIVCREYFWGNGFW